MPVKLLQSCSTLPEPIDCSLPDSLSVGFPRQEYWSGLPFPSLGSFTHPEIKAASPALQVDSVLLSYCGSLWLPRGAPPLAPPAPAPLSANLSGQLEWAGTVLVWERLLPRAD